MSHLLGFGRDAGFVCWPMIAEILTAVWGAIQHGQNYKKFSKQSHCRSQESGDFYVMPTILDRDLSMTDR